MTKTNQVCISKPDEPIRSSSCSESPWSESTFSSLLATKMAHAREPKNNHKIKNLRRKNLVHIHNECRKYNIWTTSKAKNIDFQISTFKLLKTPLIVNAESKNVYSCLIQNNNNNLAHLACCSTAWPAQCWLCSPESSPCHRWLGTDGFQGSPRDDIWHRSDAAKEKD